MKRIFLLLVVFLLSACGGGSSAPATSQPPPTSQSPTANAGPDQSVNEGTLVSLTGSGTDTDGTIVSYSWQQDGGTDVTISNSDSAEASFLAPEVTVNESLSFRLTVTDNEGATASDTVAITVIDRTADWNAFIASLETRISSEQIQLEVEQQSAKDNAGGTYTQAVYLVNARDRFAAHVSSFFDFSYSEVVRLSDSGITFPSIDVANVLSNYRTQWGVYLDGFLVSGFFSGLAGTDVENIVGVGGRSAIEFAFTRTTDRLAAFASGPWEELVVSLEYHFIFETEALESEQDMAPSQTSGANLAASRDRFINHVNSFFDFVYGDTIRLTNSGNLFSRTDVVALLDTYRDQWQAYLDWFLTSSPYFGGYGTSDFESIFIPGALSAIEDAINNTLSRLDASGRLT